MLNLTYSILLVTLADECPPLHSIQKMELE